MCTKRVEHYLMCNSDQMNQATSLRVIIGDKKIQIICKHRKIIHQCKDYLSDFENPDFIITSTPQLSEEISGSIPQPKLRLHVDGVAYKIDADALESLSVYYAIAQKMLDYDTLLVHGAAISHNNHGYVFVGPSGIGKTTHVRNWIETIPGTIIVNGDKPLINVKKRVLYGTPWCGKEGINTNTCVPLDGIIMMERSVKNRIEKISFNDVKYSFLDQVYIPKDDRLRIKALRLVNEVRNIRFYKLECNMERESAIIAYEGLAGKKIC